VSTLSRVARARRIAVTAAYGGGGIGLAGAALAGLLVGQAKLARRAIPQPKGGPPSCDGLYGTDFDGEPLTLAVLGDSSAAGLGVDLPRETPGALLAAGLAQIARRPVRVVCAAVVGAESAHLHAQVEQVLDAGPDVAAILIGGNDVTHRVKLPVAVRHLDQVVRQFVDLDVQVVVGTCPDLGTIEPIQPPLRWLARRWSRQLAAAQTIVVVEAGGRSVSLGDLLGPEFAAQPAQMFSADRFHPSATGYARAAAAMLPSVAASLGYGKDAEAAPSLARGEGLLPLPQAAVEAVDSAGTEVAAIAVDGHDRGTRGRWVELRHRIRLFTRSPEDPSVDEDEPHQQPAAEGTVQIREAP
jgi:lysophospholipase L1-like esterase